MQGRKNALELVVNMIVDDGNKNRGYRKNILNPIHRTIGVASEDHPSIELITVCNYAFHYIKNTHEDPVQKIIQDWVQEDNEETAQQIKVLNGDNYKYKIQFQYPFLIKTTTIARNENGQFIPIQDNKNKKNVEEILYNEDDS